ncbi:MAG: exo-beta-N-acetylmuramidase NamZ family protein [Gemmatimonadota bacterium]
MRFKSAAALAVLLPQIAVAQVRPGIEVFLDQPPAVLQGKRIGLITNHSGIDRQGRSTIDLLNGVQSMKLVALFSPEHGIRGVAEARVASSTDEKTGLPIHSLCGETTKPTPAMLEGVDALVYDIQDLGVRQYTYESTLALAMQAAAQKKIPIVVLDRPNPVTGTIMEGNILEPPFQTFVGIYPVLSRHGMTLGELARIYSAEQKIGSDLHVVPVQGWRRAMWWDQTGLPWVNPSPNIRRLEAAVHYPGTVFFEAINVSEMRGTDMPFEQIGAPWLKHLEFVHAMNALKLPGVSFYPTTVQVAPNARKFPGETVNAVRFVIADRNAYRPLETSLLMIEQIRKLHPAEFQWRGANAREPGLLTIERHGGTARLKQAIEAGTLRELLREWQRDQSDFEKKRAPYLLY